MTQPALPEAGQAEWRLPQQQFRWLHGPQDLAARISFLDFARKRHPLQWPGHSSHAGPRPDC